MRGAGIEILSFGSTLGGVIAIASLRNLILGVRSRCCVSRARVQSSMASVTPAVSYRHYFKNGDRRNHVWNKASSYLGKVCAQSCKFGVPAAYETRRTRVAVTRSGVKELHFELRKVQEEGGNSVRKDESRSGTLRVALICGVPSAERGISLNSARSVLDHLEMAIEWIFCNPFPCKDEWTYRHLTKSCLHHLLIEDQSSVLEEMSCCW